MTENPIQQIADALANEVMRQLDKAEESEVFAAGQTILKGTVAHFDGATLDLDLKALATVAYEQALALHETNVNSPKSVEQMAMALKKSTKALNSMVNAASREYGIITRFNVYRPTHDDDDIVSDGLGVSLLKRLV